MSVSIPPPQIHVYTLEADGQLLPASPAAVESPYSTSDVINFLTKRIPYSLPILRRMQLGPRGGQTKLIATVLPLNATGIDPQPNNEVPPLQVTGSVEIDLETIWTMAFVDRGNHPATEIWPMSSLELYHGLADRDRTTQAADVLPDSLVLPFATDVCNVATSQLLGILSNIEVTSRQSGVDILKQFKTWGSPCILAGNVHSTVSALLARAGLCLRPSKPYGKYFFPGAADPRSLIHAPDGSSVGLPDGLQWSTIGPEDYADVMAVNQIVRSAQTIARLPSAAIREVAAKEGSSQGKAVAFAFAAGDGSVRTLHVDPGWRRKGLAKAVVRRLLDTGALEPPVDGPLTASEEIRARMEGREPLVFAGIEKSNIGSIKTFEGLGAKWWWDVYWIYLDLDRVAEILG